MLRTHTPIIMLLTLLFANNLISQCHIDSIIINAVLADPSGSDMDFDTNEDGIVNSQDEYIELCNISVGTDVDISSWQLGDDDAQPFPDYVMNAEFILAAGDCITLVKNYCNPENPNCDIPGGYIDMNLPGTGFLGNNGDVLTIANASGSETCSITYGSITCAGVDPADIPIYNSIDCQYWGEAIGGCPLLSTGDSCSYLLQVLPVEFLDISVKKIEGNDALLSWKTAFESNADYYDIEHTKSLETAFRSIGKVSAAGNSSSELAYNFAIEDLNSGNHYFRLKQVDFNYQFQFSEIVSLRIDVNDNNEDISVYPTTFNRYINVKGMTDNFDIKVYNLVGKLCFESINNQVGSVYLDQLNNGMHVVQLSYSGKESEKKYVFKVLKI